MEWKVDKKSPLPLYEQVKRRLLSIIAGWTDPEKPFYTGDELCDLFGVSQITVRQATSELVAAGMLARVKGVGTFVTSEKVPEQISAETTFIDQWAKHDKAMTFDIRHMERRVCDAELASRYNLRSGEELIYIERIRKAGPIPISIDYRYVHPAVLSGCDIQELENKSILNLVRASCELDTAEITIGASRATDAISDELELLPGDPVLIRHLNYRDKDNGWRMAGYSIYRADQVAFEMVIPLSENKKPVALASSINGLGPGLVFANA